MYDLWHTTVSFHHFSAKKMKSIKMEWELKWKWTYTFKVLVPTKIKQPSNMKIPIRIFKPGNEKKGWFVTSSHRRRTGRLEKLWIKISQTPSSPSALQPSRNNSTEIWTENEFTWCSKIMEVEFYYFSPNHSRIWICFPKSHYEGSKGNIQPRYW